MYVFQAFLNFDYYGLKQMKTQNLGTFESWKEWTSMGLKYLVETARLQSCHHPYFEHNLEQR